MLRALILSSFLVVPAYGFILNGGLGAGYMMSYRSETNQLLWPFGPDIAIQINMGTALRPWGLPTKWRAGIGAGVSALSTRGTGALKIYATTLSLWGEYPLLHFSEMVFYTGIAAGGGVGIVRDNIAQSQDFTPILRTALSFKLEYRGYFPSTFWVEFKSSVFLEIYQQRISETIIGGPEVYAGFAHEH
jgi:hypothetical protein